LLAIEDGQLFIEEQLPGLFPQKSAVPSKIEEDKS
jgi:hypothetical protein